LPFSCVGVVSYHWYRDRNIPKLGGSRPPSSLLGRCLYHEKCAEMLGRR